MTPPKTKLEIEAEISIEQQKLQALQAAENATIETLIALKNELIEATEVTNG